jgi:hypothetical protein
MQTAAGIEVEKLNEQLKQFTEKATKYSKKYNFKETKKLLIKILEIREKIGNICQENNIPPPPLPPPPPPPPPPPSNATTKQNKESAKKAAGQAKAAEQEKVVSYLDLINQGNFNLKKVVQNDKPKPLTPKEERDPSSLSLQDILLKTASIREAVECSNSSDTGSESSSDW